MVACRLPVLLPPLHCSSTEFLTIAVSTQTTNLALPDCLVLKMAGTQLLQCLSPQGHLIPHNKGLSFLSSMLCLICLHILLDHWRLCQGIFTVMVSGLNKSSFLIKTIILPCENLKLDSENPLQTHEGILHLLSQLASISKWMNIQLLSTHCVLYICAQDFHSLKSQTPL